MPYIRGLSEQSGRIAKKHWFRTSFNLGNKVRMIKLRCQKALREKRRVVMYEIPCKCKEAVYVGDIGRLFETRKKEHEGKLS